VHGCLSEKLRNSRKWVMPSRGQKRPRGKGVGFPLRCRGFGFMWARQEPACRVVIGVLFVAKGKIAGTNERRAKLFWGRNYVRWHHSLFRALRKGQGRSSTDNDTVTAGCRWVVFFLVARRAARGGIITVTTA